MTLPRMSLTAAAAVLATAGCSYLYDADDLRGRDASAAADARAADGAIGDAPADDGPIGDAADDAGADLDGGGDDAGGADAAGADGGVLSIGAPTPMVIPEGTGSGGGRPALVVVEASGISDGVVLAAAFDEGAGPAVAILEQVVSTELDRIAFTLAIPVLTTYGQSTIRTLRVTATEPGSGATAHVDLDVACLDELEPMPGTFVIGQLDALYSRAVIGGGIYIGGLAPARVRVTSSLTIAATIDVSGVGTVPGPGGCMGGTTTIAGQCVPGGGGGGGALLAAPGGGGAGFGEAGDPGTGQSAGAGGGITGNAMLTPLGASGNRGNGGGGGGGLLEVLPGGPGGGGGGSIGLTARGAILVSQNGRVVAAGGEGGTGLGGGGGGGSGGAILVRAGGGIETDHAWLEAPGGAATAGGGAGGAGRIRVDAPDGVDAALSGSADAHAGPLFPVDAPRIVRLSPLTLELTGDPDRTYGLLVNGAVAGEGAAGGDSVDVDLAPGINQICAMVADGLALDTAESGNCIEVALIP